MWRWEDVKMRRCEDEKMWSEKMWRWEDVNMRRCEDEKMWRWEDVTRRRCEDEKMWRWEDVKWEDVKMRRWEDVKMRRCEDEKVWRWEDEIQTPTIGRTLHSDALGEKNEVDFHQIKPGQFFRSKYHQLSSQAYVFVVSIAIYSPQFTSPRIASHPCCALAAETGRNHQWPNSGPRKMTGWRKIGIIKISG